MLVDVFVYGTLKPGEVNYQLCQALVVKTQPAIAQGVLFHLPLGYPAAVLGEKGWVQGYVLSFADPGVLLILDEFEQHDPVLFQQVAPRRQLTHYQYQRQQVETFTPERSPLGFAWCYGMTLNQVRQLSGQAVLGGLWQQTQ